MDWKLSRWLKKQKGDLNLSSLSVLSLIPIPTLLLWTICFSRINWAWGWGALWWLGAGWCAQLSACRMFWGKFIAREKASLWPKQQCEPCEVGVFVKEAQHAGCWKATRRALQLVCFSQVSSLKICCWRMTALEVLPKTHENAWKWTQTGCVESSGCVRSFWGLRVLLIKQNNPYRHKWSSRNNLPLLFLLSFQWTLEDI